MRIGRAVAAAQQDAANARKICDCGHPLYEHHELDRTDPEYAPLHFHCTVDKCACVRVVE